MKDWDNWTQKRKIIYENIDYLELKLLWPTIKDLLAGIVENSPKKIVWDLFKFEIRFRARFWDWKYMIYDIYFLDSEINKTEPIGSINWIKSDTSKSGVFLTFPGYPFATETDIITITFLDAIQYNYEHYKFIPYRSDYCIDVQWVEVQDIYDLLYTEKIPFVIPNIIDPKTWKMTWFKLPFSEDILRVYNKKLDISDRETFETIDKYQEYLDNPLHITRIELQLNRPKFKKKIIYDLTEITQYSKQALYKKINKYINTENLPTKNIILKKDINYQEINQAKKLKYSKTMFLAYYNKLYNTIDWKKYLKQHYSKIYSELFPLNPEKM